jgi:hypothetical protein
MWLVASTETSLVSGDFKVRGFIEESLLATQAHWKKLSAEARDHLEVERLAT